MTPKFLLSNSMFNGRIALMIKTHPNPVKWFPFVIAIVGKTR
jgi:predicted metalloenzyme YecM